MQIRRHFERNAEPAIDFELNVEKRPVSDSGLQLLILALLFFGLFAVDFALTADDVL